MEVLAIPGGGRVASGFVARGNARHVAAVGNNGSGRARRKKPGDNSNSGISSSSSNNNRQGGCGGSGGGGRRGHPHQLHGPEPFASSFRSFLPVASDDDEDDGDNDEDSCGARADAGPPASGEDYLRWVRRQAARCPDVVTVPLDRNKVRKSTRPLPGEEEEQSRAGGGPGAGPRRKTPPPSAEWESRFLEAFRERGKSLRRYVSDRVKEEDKSRVGLPTPKDMNGWRSFLYGQGKPCGASGRRGSESEPAAGAAEDGGERGEAPTAGGGDVDDRGPVAAEDGSEAGESSVRGERDEDAGRAENSCASADEEVPAVGSLSVSSAPDERSASFGGEHPTLSLLAKFDQNICLNLLDFHVRWIAGSGMSVQQAQWIFAVLTRLDPLLEASEVAVLRDLCRECLKLRAGLSDPGDPQLVLLDPIITIISGAFGQADLSPRYGT